MTLLISRLLPGFVVAMMSVTGRESVAKTGHRIALNPV
jgi:hypothetical protein